MKLIEFNDARKGTATDDVDGKDIHTKHTVPITDQQNDVDWIFTI